MDYERIEKQLESAYKRWQDDKFVAESGLNFSTLSQPFFIGVPSQFNKSKKTILVYGQEANNFGKYNNEWSINGIQKWCREYTEIQINSAKDSQKNNSAFWRFINALGPKDFNIIWGNLDKIHMYSEGKTKCLSVAHELWLNGHIAEGNKTIIDFEIDAIDPDAVVFAVGPNYHVSLSQALSINSNELNKCRPTKEKSLVDISHMSNKDTKVFWTYHPKYQSYIKKLEENALDILRSL